MTGGVQYVLSGPAVEERIDQVLPSCSRHTRTRPDPARRATDGAAGVPVLVGTSRDRHGAVDLGQGDAHLGRPRRGLLDPREVARAVEAEVGEGRAGASQRRRRASAGLDVELLRATRRLGDPGEVVRLALALADEGAGGLEVGHRCRRLLDLDLGLVVVVADQALLAAGRGPRPRGGSRPTRSPYRRRTYVDTCFGSLTRDLTASGPGTRSPSTGCCPRGRRPRPGSARSSSDRTVSMRGAPEGLASVTGAPHGPPSGRKAATTSSVAPSTHTRAEPPGSVSGNDATCSWVTWSPVSATSSASTHTWAAEAGVVTPTARAVTSRARTAATVVAGAVRRRIGSLPRFGSNV